MPLLWLSGLSGFEEIDSEYKTTFPITDVVPVANNNLAEFITAIPPIPV